MALILAGTTAPSVAALANLIFAALSSKSITTGGKSWSFDPNSLDFSQVGDITITTDGPTARVKLSFRGSASPFLEGTIDLDLLEAQLTTTPNVLDYNSPAPLGPASVVSLTSPNFTKQKSGQVYITAEYDGTQSAQAVVSVALYRDYGLPGQVALNAWHVAPGGLGSFNWSGHIHDTDVLPDALPHTYTVIATASGGSSLSVATGAASIMVVELGGPG